MKQLIATVLSTVLVLNGISLIGYCQSGVAQAQADLDKCIEELNAHDIRVNNLRVLWSAYGRRGGHFGTLPKNEQEQFDNWEKELWRLVAQPKYDHGPRDWLCVKIKMYEDRLNSEVERSKAPPTPTPTPTPEPYTGPPIIPVDPNMPKITDEEVKEFLENLRRIDPLSAEINDWVKKRKAKLPPATPPEGLKTSTDMQTGVQTLKFEIPTGTISVFLPDDIRAGDAISGTVIEEPKGRDEKERANNLAELKGFAIELTFSSNIGAHVAATGETIRKFAVNVPTNIGGNVPSCNLVTKSGADIAKTSIAVNPPPPVISKLPVINKLFPTIGQSGRLIEIPGRFDGSLDTTKVKFGEMPVIPVAETPRGIVVRCPTNVTGPVDVTIDENGQITKGTYRNVGIGLSAPNTNLKRGEKTTLTVQVTGLAGIRNDVPLQLVKTGTVTMDGGDTQHIRIRAQDVRPDGTFSLTREITGVQAGGFNVTATVFDPTRRPVVIPLTQGARVNGYEVVTENGKPVLVAGGVIDPLTGKPLDGTHRLEAGCGNPVLSKIPYLSRLFKNGDAKFDKTDCLVFITPRIIVE